MDVVLGVSVMTTTVRMVLIEGENADGVIIECATFDTAEGAVKASPSEQISAAILATQQNAVSQGHHLVLSGVTVWSLSHRESSERGPGRAAERSGRIGQVRGSSARSRDHGSDGAGTGDRDIVGRRQRRWVNRRSANVRTRRS